MVAASLVIGKSSSDHPHVLSCYSPTFAASRESKDDFSDVLQQALPVIPSRENFVVLGYLLQGETCG